MNTEVQETTKTIRGEKNIKTEKNMQDKNKQKSTSRNAQLLHEA